jgi:hypothetical protein
MIKLKQVLCKLLGHYWNIKHVEGDFIVSECNRCKAELKESIWEIH